MIRYLNEIAYVVIFYFMKLCNNIIGVKDNKAVFISFGGKSYSGSPRAISEELYAQFSDFEIIWLFNDPPKKKTLLPSYIKPVKINTVRAFIELSTAKIWVDNFPKPKYIYKSKNQFYIQTWHGDRGFKKVLYDSTFVKGSKYIESEICDVVLSGSDYADRVYKSAFRYNGKILKKGSPRNDKLIYSSAIDRNRIRNHLSIPDDIKVLLYAPTLRREAAKQQKNQDISSIDLYSILNLLVGKTKSEWVCLVRAHSAVRGLSGISMDGKKIIDVSDYEEMSDLLLVSDFLITDYSSTAGDFALRGKPIVLFQSDRDKYLKNDRTFYFDIDKSPFIVAKTQEELNDIILKLNDEDAKINCQKILDFYGTIESGEASKAVVNYINSHCKGV